MRAGGLGATTIIRSAVTVRKGGSSSSSDAPSPSPGASVSVAASAPVSVVVATLVSVVVATPVSVVVATLVSVVVATLVSVVVATPVSVVVATLVSVVVATPVSVVIATLVSVVVATPVSVVVALPPPVVSPSVVVALPPPVVSPSVVVALPSSVVVASPASVPLDVSSSGSASTFSRGERSSLTTTLSPTPTASMPTSFSGGTSTRVSLVTRTTTLPKGVPMVIEEPSEATALTMPIRLFRVSWPGGTLPSAAAWDKPYGEGSETTGTPANEASNSPTSSALMARSIARFFRVSIVNIMLSYPSRS